jgi:hypothetical protein
MLEDFGDKYQISKKLHRCPICHRYLNYSKETIYNLNCGLAGTQMRAGCKACWLKEVSKRNVLGEPPAC